MTAAAGSDGNLEGMALKTISPSQALARAWARMPPQGQTGVGGACGTFGMRGSCYPRHVGEREAGR